MAGGTHVFDMIKRIRENDNLRKFDYFKARKKYTRITGNLNVDYKTVAPHERQGIRNAVLHQVQQERLKSIIALVLAILAISLLFFGLFHLFT